MAVLAYLHVSYSVVLYLNQMCTHGTATLAANVCSHARHTMAEMTRSFTLTLNHNIMNTSVHVQSGHGAVPVHGAFTA